MATILPVANFTSTASGSVDIVEPGGKVCGSVTPSGNYNLGGEVVAVR